MKTNTLKAAIRRKRLRALVDETSQKALGDAAGVSLSQLGQWLSGDRNISEMSARKLEAGGRKPDGWLDVDPDHPQRAAMPELSDSRTVAGSDSVLEYGGQPGMRRPVPVVGTARMGDDGYYEELGHPAGFGDGWIDWHSSDENAYALRVKGDSMHPAIRHGQFVLVEPNAACTPGEYVVIQLRDGRKMVKELIRESADEVVIESVNGNARATLDRQDIERMHAVAGVILGSRWRPA